MKNNQRRIKRFCCVTYAETIVDCYQEKNQMNLCSGGLGYNVRWALFFVFGNKIIRKIWWIDLHHEFVNVCTINPAGLNLIIYPRVKFLFAYCTFRISWSNGILHLLLNYSKANRKYFFLSKLNTFRSRVSEYLLLSWIKFKNFIHFFFSSFWGCDWLYNLIHSFSLKKTKLDCKFGTLRT